MFLSLHYQGTKVICSSRDRILTASFVKRTFGTICFCTVLSSKQLGGVNYLRSIKPVRRGLETQISSRARYCFSRHKTTASTAELRWTQSTKGVRTPAVGEVHTPALADSNTHWLLTSSTNSQSTSIACQPQRLLLSRSLHSFHLHAFCAGEWNDD